MCIKSIDFMHRVVFKTHLILLEMHATGSMIQLKLKKKSNFTGNIVTLYAKVTHYKIIQYLMNNWIHLY